MLIKCLVENTSFSKEFANEHGLSLYIETSKHKLLFDLGESGLFLENAKKLNVNIKDIDTVIISHGHNDHGGALKKFLAVNKTAKIYINRRAFETHLSIHNGLEKDIGLPKDVSGSSQVILIDSNLKIDDELFIFNDIKDNKFIAESNSNLFKRNKEETIKDDFTHEQNLIITDNDKSLLIAGCAHRGIVNILSRANEHSSNGIDYCIGGFHLSSPRRGTREKDELIYAIVKELQQSKTMFYTCHCTGLEVYHMMKEKMGDQLDYINTGKILHF